MGYTSVPLNTAAKYEFALIARVQASDRAEANRAFLELQRRHFPLVRRFAARIHCSAFDREDVYQRLRLALWKAIINYDDKRGVPFVVYLYPCLKLETIAIMREGSTWSSRNIAFTDVGPAIDAVEDGSRPLDAVIMNAAIAGPVRSFLLTLSPNAQDLVRLRFMRQMTSAEVARLRGVSRAAVSKSEKRIRDLGIRALSGVVDATK
jgi:RNA polymerase sigma factor (sigma-70 family)